MEDKKNEKAQIRIKNAFIQLLQNKPFESITATEIIHAANVNRTTFYAYYKDKYNLFEEVENEFYEPLLDNMRNIVKDLNNIPQMFPTMIKQTVNYYFENRKMLKMFTGENGDPNFWLRFSKKVQKIVIESQASKHLRVQSEYIISCFVGAVSGMLRVWVDNDFRETPEEFAGMVYKIVKGIPENVFISEDSHEDN